MFVRNGQLAIARHANVAVTNGRFTTLIVEMPSTHIQTGERRHCRLDFPAID